MDWAIQISLKNLTFRQIVSNSFTTSIKATLEKSKAWLIWGHTGIRRHTGTYRYFERQNYRYLELPELQTNYKQTNKNTCRLQTAFPAITRGKNLLNKAKQEKRTQNFFCNYCAEYTSRSRERALLQPDKER